MGLNQREESWGDRGSAWSQETRFKDAEVGQAHLLLRNDPPYTLEVHRAQGIQQVVAEEMAMRYKASVDYETQNENIWT